MRSRDRLTLTSSCLSLSGRYRLLTVIPRTAAAGKFLAELAESEAAVVRTAGRCRFCRSQGQHQGALGARDLPLTFNFCVIVANVLHFWCAEEGGVSGPEPVRRVKLCPSPKLNRPRLVRGRTSGLFLGPVTTPPPHTHSDHSFRQAAKSFLREHSQSSLGSGPLFLFSACGQACMGAGVCQNPSRAGSQFARLGL